VKEILESTGGQGSLAASVAYRNATLWQPQQRTLQAFVSRTLTDTVFKGFGVFDYAGDTGKAFLTRFRAEPRAVTFSTSSDAGIYQHELHIPQALVLNWVGQALLAPRYGEIIGNEAMARYVLNAVSAAEKNYKQSKGQYGTLDDLVKSNMLPGFFREQKAYNFEVTLSGESFSATATPAEYGPKGKHSFFIDSSGVLRSGDLNGRRATASEPPVAGDTLGGIF
jgi:hypothetical protein